MCGGKRLGGLIQRLTTARPQSPTLALYDLNPQPAVRIVVCTTQGLLRLRLTGVLNTLTVSERFLRCGGLT